MHGSDCLTVTAPAGTDFTDSWEPQYVPGSVLNEPLTDVETEAQTTSLTCYEITEDSSWSLSPVPGTELLKSLSSPKW